MNISWLGGGERLSVCIKRLGELSAGAPSDVLVLPIPTTRDKRCVLGTDVELKRLSSYVKPGAVVAGYGLSDEVCRELSTLGAYVYDAALDETFLSDNADISALGAFGYLLSNFKRSAEGLKIGIVGYGRIGARLAKLILFVGGGVRIYTTRMHLAQELNEHGMPAEFIKPTTDISGLDVLFNTAPAKLFSEEKIRSLLSSGGVLVDLASGGFYADIPECVRLPSIPEKYYPVTAGEIYADGIKRFISEVIK